MLIQSFPLDPERNLHERFGADSPQLRRAQISAQNRVDKADRCDQTVGGTFIFDDLNDQVILPFPQTFGLSERLWIEADDRMRAVFDRRHMPMIGLHELGAMFFAPRLAD